MNALTRRALVASVAAGSALSLGSKAAKADPGGNLPVGEVADLQALRARGGTGITTLFVQACDQDGLGCGIFHLDLEDSSTLDDGGIVIVDSTGGRWKRIFDGSVRAEWFGAEGVSQAVASATARKSDLAFGAQTYHLRSDLEMPPGRTYVFAPGTLLEIAIGKTVTIRGEVSAPDAPIFFGKGRIVGIRDVAPEWWGAVADGKGDYAGAIQAAFDCVAASQDSDGELQRVRLSGNYRIGKTVEATVSAAVNLRVSGGGTIFGGARLTAAAAFNGDVAIHVRGQAEGDLQAIADWGLSDFAVVGEPGTSCRVGIKIGEGEKSLIGLQKSLVQGVHAGGFATCWQVTNARLIKFENCSGWADSVANGVALSITLESVDFTGDIEFDSCQFVAPQETGRAVSVTHSQTYAREIGGGQLKGIYFSNCSFYKGAFYFEIYGQSGAVLGDIWLDKCQFDGFGMTQLRVGAEGGASIENVRVTNCYFRGVNDGFFAILADIAPGGVVRSLHLSDNWIANCLSRAVLLRRVENLVFDQNSFVECADKESIVYIETGSTWQANHNSLTQAASATAPHFIVIDASSAPIGIAIGNTAGEKAVSSTPVDDRRERFKLRLANGVAVSDGRLGIGTESPNYQLHVAGTFGIAPGDKVDPEGVGDIVFELTSDSQITLKAKGADGNIRTAVIELK